MRSIFSIFEDDFGTLPQNIVKWIQKYLPEKLKEELNEIDIEEITIKNSSDHQSLEKKKNLKSLKG